MYFSGEILRSILWRRPAGIPPSPRRHAPVTHSRGRTGTHCKFGAPTTHPYSQRLNYSLTHSLTQSAHWPAKSKTLLCESASPVPRLTRVARHGGSLKTIGPCSVAGHAPPLPWVMSRVWVRVRLGSGLALGKWVGTWPVNRLDPNQSLVNATSNRRSTGCPSLSQPSTALWCCKLLSLFLFRFFRMKTVCPLSRWDVRPFLWCWCWCCRSCLLS